LFIIIDTGNAFAVLIHHPSVVIIRALGIYLPVKIDAIGKPRLRIDDRRVLQRVAFVVITVFLFAVRIVILDFPQESRIRCISKFGQILILLFAQLCRINVAHCCLRNHLGDFIRIGPAFIQTPVDQHLLLPGQNKPGRGGFRAIGVIQPILNVGMYHRHPVIYLPAERIGSGRLEIASFFIRPAAPDVILIMPPVPDLTGDQVSVTNAVVIQFLVFAQPVLRIGVIGVGNLQKSRSILIKEIPALGGTAAGDKLFGNESCVRTVNNDSPAQAVTFQVELLINRLISYPGVRFHEPQFASCQEFLQVGLYLRFRIIVFFFQDMQSAGNHIPLLSVRQTEFLLQGIYVQCFVINDRLDTPVLVPFRVPDQNDRFCRLIRIIVKESLDVVNAVSFNGTLHYRPAEDTFGLDVTVIDRMVVVIGNHLSAQGRQAQVSGFIGYQITIFYGLYTAVIPHIMRGQAQ